jgi:hypothetical protein
MYRDKIIDEMKLVFKEYRFELQGEAVWVENEDVVIARKGDLELLFHLGRSQLFYYCSLGIRLSGELAIKATPNSRYYSLGVAAIAKCLEPGYKRSPKAAQTNAELKELLEIEKADLLNYRGFSPKHSFHARINLQMPDEPVVG